MKKIKVVVAFLLLVVMLCLQGCQAKDFSQIVDDVDCVVNNVMHNPSGLNNLYGSKEVTAVPYERIPRDVTVNDTVIIKAATQPIDARQEVWIEWQKNGKMQRPIKMSHSQNTKIDGVMSAIWQGNLGKFNKGDLVEYKIYVGNDNKAKRATNNFTFNVCDWENVVETTSLTTNDNGLQLTLKTDKNHIMPSLQLTLDGSRLNFSLSTVNELVSKSTLNDGKLTEKDDKFVISNENVVVEITKKPFGIVAYNNNGEKVFSTSSNALSILTDGKKCALQARININAEKNEIYQGFGMKYNALNQRGYDVDIYCVNWYTNQNEETYTPTPYYFSPNRYGFYLDSTYYSHFDMCKSEDDVVSVYQTLGSDINTQSDFYVFVGDNQQISKSYSSVVGKAKMLPVWAFGPWISANEWNRQSEIETQINKTISNEIPTSVIVIEAWSDEDTFYIFNDAVYKNVDGDENLSLSDFTYKGRWKNPKEMVDYAHKNNIKIILWQIPVMRYSTNPTVQHSIDLKYAEKMGYLLKNLDGSIYRMPKDTWFGYSNLIDFTNPMACEWFMSKHKYLITEVGIDGFKTDGGEFVWGKNAVSYDNRLADELRNAYPDVYAQAYFDYARRYYPEAITFSRAGGAKMGSHPACWIGDQTSSFESLQSAVIALQSASISNMPFVTWDTAGFSGNLPTVELYKRSVSFSAFTPLMQIHSEQSGDPNLSMARTPWNMAECKNDDSCLEIYRYFANVRMNLLPYTYSQSKFLTDNSMPLMQSMAYAFGLDNTTCSYENQYMYGQNMLVAPVVTANARNYKAYLPEGDWYNLFDGKYYKGNQTITTAPNVDKLNVFVKGGSIIPFNTDETLKLGSFVGNDTNSHDVLGLMIYPSQKQSLTFDDYVSNSEITVNSTNNSGKIEITIDKPLVKSLSIRVDNASKVTVNGQQLPLNGSYCWFDESTNMLNILSNGGITSAIIEVNK